MTSKVQSGSIVLFHNAGEHTPEALPDILDYLLAEGYKIVPISKILLTCDYTIDHEGRQCPKSKLQVKYPHIFSLIRRRYADI